MKKPFLSSGENILGMGIESPPLKSWLTKLCTRHVKAGPHKTPGGHTVSAAPRSRALPCLCKAGQAWRGKVGSHRVPGDAGWQRRTGGGVGGTWDGAAADRDLMGNLGLKFCASGKETACNAGDTGSIPGWGRSPGEGNGNPLHGLENSMDRGAWQATVHGVAKGQTRLGDWHFLYTSFVSKMSRLRSLWGSPPAPTISDLE